MSAPNDITISLLYPIVENGHDVAVPLKARIPMKWAGGGVPLPSTNEVLRIYKSRKSRTKNTRKKKSFEIAEILKDPVFFNGELLSLGQTTALGEMIMSKYGQGDEKVSTNNTVVAHTPLASPRDKQKSGVALPEPLAKLVNAEAERKGTTRKAVVIERLWESYRTKPDEGKE